MADVSMRLIGVEQAMANLKSLEAKIVRRAVSAGIRAGNAVLVKSAKSHAPRKSGALVKSMRGSVKLDRATGTVKGTIRSKSTKAQRKKGFDAYYMHMVAGGTKPHIIKYTKAKALKIGEGYAAVAHHPAQRRTSLWSRLPCRQRRQLLKRLKRN